MGDSNLFEWLSLIGLVMPVLIWLVIALVMRRVFGRVFGFSSLRTGGSLLGNLFPKWRWVMRAGLSLFAGLMIATASMPPFAMSSASTRIGTPPSS